MNPLELTLKAKVKASLFSYSNSENKFFRESKSIGWW